MKLNLLTTISLMCFPFAFGQVGIGTDTPQAALDINGNIKIREVSVAQSLAEDQTVLFIDNTNLGDFEVKKVTTEGLAETLSTHLSSSIKFEGAYSAYKSSGISLLTASIFQNYQPVIFSDTDRIAGDPDLFVSNTSNSYYEVPSDGLYHVSFSFTYGTGLLVGLLSGTPSIGIIKRNASDGNFVVILSKDFAGINLGLANITLSSADLTSIFELKAGDRLYFGVMRDGVNLNLLSSSKASLSIFKVSN